MINRAGLYGQIEETPLFLNLISLKLGNFERKY